MNHRILSGTALLLMLGAPLAAQEVRYGVAVNLAAPVGGFNSSTIPSSVSGVAVQETYNSGAGADFLVCLPLNPLWAIRFNAGVETFTGNASPVGGYSWNLQDQVFTIGAVAQYFFDGNAIRQNGTYLMFGAAMDFENFESSNGDPNYDPYTSTVNVTRPAALVGIGHTFRSRWGGRYMLEAAYHKTLASDNLAAGNQPPSDYVRFTFGFIF